MTVFFCLSEIWGDMFL